MKYQVVKKFNYAQAKKVELQFLEPGDILALNNCGDYDVNADMILLDFKVKKGKESNTICFNFIQPNGESDYWYETFYNTEPVYTVIGKAEIKKITEENTPVL